MKARILMSMLLLGSCAAPPPEGPPGPPIELAGRTAGPPQHCISLNQTESLRVSQNDPHTLVYGNGRTVWANHLGPGCWFRWDTDVLVTQPTGSELCRGDIVRSFDRSSRLPGRACVLSDFVPYRSS